MREVVVAGIGMHKAGKFMEKSLKDLGRVAVWNAIRDSGIDAKKIECAYVGNAVAGLITGQEMVRGQVILRNAGIGGIPIVNVETACASGTLAFREAWIAVVSGLYDVALAVGVEKMFCDDTPRSIKAVASASDVEHISNLGFQFMGQYGAGLRNEMERFGWSQELFAEIAAKGKYNGSLNPIAQYQKAMTVEEILHSRVVAWPLTLFMCSSMADGAAAAILIGKDVLSKYTDRPPLVTVAAQVTRTGKFVDPRIHSRHDEVDDETPTGPSGRNEIVYEAYEKACLGPEDIDVAEVHDAVAPAELRTYSGLGFCQPGREAEFFREGHTLVSGDIPVNPSGGLAARGHPIGATGLYQIGELTLQLRGEAGARQAKGRKGDGAKVALAANGGGVVEGGPGASCATILKR